MKIDNLIKILTRVDDFTYSKIKYKKQNCTQIERWGFTREINDESCSLNLIMITD